jgi:acetyl-CoA C-acetyltransferase
MASQRSVVFAEPVRTAIGTFGGSLKDVSAPHLGAVAIDAAVARAKLRPDEVETVVMGNVVQAGTKMNPACQAAVPCGTAGDDAGADRQSGLRLGRAGHRLGA